MRLKELVPGVSMFIDEPETAEERDARIARETEREARRIRADQGFAELVMGCGGRVDYAQVPFDRETGTLVQGVFELPNGYVLSVHRMWAYFAAKLIPSLPIKGDDSAGILVNEFPCDPELVRGRYAGREPHLGSVCHAYGCAGGYDKATLLRHAWLDHWHIDNPQALPVLVTVLRKVIVMCRLKDSEQKIREIDYQKEQLLTWLEVNIPNFEFDKQRYGDAWRPTPLIDFTLKELEKLGEVSDKHTDLIKRAKALAETT